MHINNIKKGLILTYPYGSYIINKTKKIIVKSKKFTSISNISLLLIENKIGLAIIELDDPKKINLSEFKKMYKYHKITEEDRLLWWPNYKILHVYKIKKLYIFNKPILLNYGPGPQVTINLDNISLKHIYIGTSGFYPSIGDYNLNSVEINNTFYKFPTTSLINHLDKLNLVYSIKVNQIITHYKQLKNVSTLWNDFYKSFDQIRNKVKCFLFQFNEKFIPNENNFKKIKKFSKKLNRQYKYVFEFRHNDWFTKENIKFINNLGIIMCSLYSFNNNFVNIYKNTCYFRLHGTKSMYRGSYYDSDLNKIYNLVSKKQINNFFCYFNNTDDGNAETDSNKFIKKFSKINLSS